MISGNYINGSGEGISAGPHDVIAGNFVGLDAAGTTSIGNGSTGVGLGNYDLVGGTVPAAANVISGNDGELPLVLDVDLTWDVGMGSHDDLIGNSIGTQCDGRTAVLPPAGSDAPQGAADFGVLLLSGQVADTIQQNVIADHPYVGLGIALGADTGNVVDDNMIESNVVCGIAIMGDTAPSSPADANQFVGNTIAANGAGNAGAYTFSGGPGIAVVSYSPGGYYAGSYDTVGNTFEQNSIYGNSGPGIDLGAEFWDSGAPGDTAIIP